MDPAAKYKLIEKIVQLEDDALLEEVNALLKSRQPDYHLPESHKQLLDQRLAEDNAQPGAGEDWRTAASAKTHERRSHHSPRVLAPASACAFRTGSVRFQPLG
jgi:hypothetical protein